VELIEAENIVRSYLLNQKPLSFRRGQTPAGDTHSCRPEPDECFEFPGGMVVVEYESRMPVVCVSKYWWLLHKTDVMSEGKKLALVVIILDAEAAPKDQLARQRAMAEQLEKDYPGFRFFIVESDQARPDVISDAVAKAFEVVKA
jgi:hypothetical protein